MLDSSLSHLAASKSLTDRLGMNRSPPPGVFLPGVSLPGVTDSVLPGDRPETSRLGLRPKRPGERRGVLCGVLRMEESAEGRLEPPAVEAPLSDRLRMRPLEDEFSLIEVLARPRKEEVKQN